MSASPAAGRPCFFVSDLHGRPARYGRLFSAARAERPRAVFLGGDLLPHPATSAAPSFVADVLLPGFLDLRERLGREAPRVFLIPGNDDPRAEEEALVHGERSGAWQLLVERRVEWEGRPVFGYPFVPPTPFLLKDWERFDVSRFVDPGSVSPEEGRRTVPADPRDVRLATIERDLARLAGDEDLSEAVFLLHSPPYRTALDRAALDGKAVDHAPLDVHVGSVAVRRFVEARRPLLVLCGHVHESARLTGAWRERIGRTWCLSAAHDGEELALVRFRPEELEGATRELL